MGRPVISFDHGGASESIKNNITGSGLFTSFVAAAHPPTGGRAPGKEPIMVFKLVLVF